MSGEVTNDNPLKNEQKSLSNVFREIFYKRGRIVREKQAWYNVPNTY